MVFFGHTYFLLDHFREHIEKAFSSVDENANKRGRQGQNQHLASKNQAALFHARHPTLPCYHTLNRVEIAILFFHLGNLSGNLSNLPKIVVYFLGTTAVFLKETLAFSDLRWYLIFIMNIQMR